MSIHVSRSSLVPIESVPEILIFFSFRIFWISELWLKQSPGNKIEHQYPGCGCGLNLQGRVELQRVG